MDGKYEQICAKKWDQVNEDDLRYVYLEKGLTQNQIAAVFQVSKSQVKSRVSKYGISKNAFLMADALKKARKDARLGSIDRLIFAEDPFSDQEDGLEYGPVKIIGGPHKGRIGILDDVDGNKAHVYFGDMTKTLDSWTIIPVRYLDNHITTFDLVTRLEDLEREIALYRAQRPLEGRSAPIDAKLVDLYGEYTLALQLLTKVYIDTFYLQSDGKKNVFISHSSVDSRLALMIASDLKRAKYRVWFDKWDLLTGHSIPQAITEGLDAADALIIVLTKDYLRSAFCKDEWQGFYMKYNGQNRLIIVVIADESDPPTLLSSRRYYRLNDGNPYNDMITELKRALAHR